MIRVTDPNDARISAYRDIRERDLVGRDRRFIAEGRVVLTHLVASRQFSVESLLVLESRMQGIADLVSRLPEDVLIYVADRPVMDAVAGFPMHRGVLAVGLRGAPLPLSKLLGGLGAVATLVVCIGISNHDNIGAIFRNAAAFGSDAVLLDATCCDPLYRKAIRVSVGAALRVPFCTFDRADDLMRELSNAGFLQLALSPTGVRDIRTLQRRPRTAIYLGAEGPGLPVSVIDNLIATRIELAQGFDSLNVAAASAIALHRLAETPSL